MSSPTKKGKINVEEMEFILKQEDGPPIDLFHRSGEAVKNAVRRWVRNTILGQLAEQCSGEEPRRKDMVGLCKQVNITATRSLLRTKTSPIHGVPVTHYRQLLASVIAGTHGAKDRLNAA